MLTNLFRSERDTCECKKCREDKKNQQKTKNPEKCNLSIRRIKQCLICSTLAVAVLRYLASGYLTKVSVGQFLEQAGLLIA